MLHIPYYCIEGQIRLARDCRFSHTAIGRLVRGKTTPSYRLVYAVTTSLSARLGVPLDIRDVFSTDGTYPTSCVCDIIPDCNGCFPPEAYRDVEMLPEYLHQKPSDWCRYRPMPEPDTNHLTSQS